MSATSAPRLARVVRPRLAVRGLFARLLRYEARHRSRVDLKALDDTMLRDIGLTRADVDAELRRPLRW